MQFPSQEALNDFFGAEEMRAKVCKEDDINESMTVSTIASWGSGGQDPLSEVESEDESEGYRAEPYYYNHPYEISNAEEEVDTEELKGPDEHPFFLPSGIAGINISDEDIEGALPITPPPPKKKNDTNQWRACGNNNM